MPSESEQSLNVKSSQADSPKERLQLVPDLQEDIPFHSDVLELFEVPESHEQRLLKVVRRLGELSALRTVLLTYVPTDQPKSRDNFVRTNPLTKQEQSANTLQSAMPEQLATLEQFIDSKPLDEPKPRATPDQIKNARWLAASKRVADIYEATRVNNMILEAEDETNGLIMERLYLESDSAIERDGGTANW